jgi:pyrroloquinoline-quinone synthase
MERLALAAPLRPPTDAAPWTAEEFERRLRAKEKFYHIHHELHVRMNSGQLGRAAIPAIRGWVANRFYYQVAIPMKDAAVLSSCPDREIRRAWVQRILDHDGRRDDEGGIEAWLRLGDAVGLPREELLDHRHVLPGVRFAVDAYLLFARRASWQEAACASLTELFAPTIHQARLDTWPGHYPWIKPEGYQYFRRRLSEARRDVASGLAITLASFRTRSEQEHALDILQYKLDILWHMLDAMYLAYVDDKPPYWNVKARTTAPEGE